MNALYNIADYFASNGPLSDLLDSYEIRTEQVQMAESVYRAIQDDESLICEAGTGTGKTFAYLLPALLSGKKIIVSTATRHLQDQLYYRDIPLVRNLLSSPVHISLLKGRANYLCLHRLEEFRKDNSILDAAISSDLQDIVQWVPETSTGDLAEVTTLSEHSTARTVITSTAENCLGQSCDFFEDCFVVKARRRAIETDLVVVNHHLLLADLALRESGFAEVLPSADIIIFDESHQLPDLATGFFGTSSSSHQIMALIKDCTVAFHNDAMDMDLMPLLDTLQLACRQARLAFGAQEGRFDWNTIAADADVTAAMDQLIDRLIRLEEVLDQISVRAKSLDNCWQRCTRLLAWLQDYLERESQDTIQWLELSGQGFQLHQTPLKISELFREKLSQHDCASIYTSATLSVDGNFSYFADQLGLQDVAVQHWDSPFDYQRQALLYLPVNLPEPATEGYTEAVVDAAIPVIKASQGHAFLLFTSHRALNRAAANIRRKIRYPVFVQGDAPRSELLSQFRNTRHAVLLGTSSFWEGVDVKGAALSCVIIDKLPFATPDDPVFRARAAYMESEGRNPFMEYQIPEAVIALRQGVGRLIRDRQDYGVLMICDPRITSKSYGRKFLISLPNMPQTRELNTVRNFYKDRHRQIKECQDVSS